MQIFRAIVRGASMIYAFPVRHQDRCSFFVISCRRHFFVAREQGSHETLAIKIVFLGLHVIFCKDSIEHKLTEVSYLSYG